MKIHGTVVRSQVLVALLSPALLASCGDLADDVTPAIGAASAKSAYTFTKLGALNGAAPGGGTYVNDFEPGALNSSGQFSYAADVSSGGEGVFLGKGTSIIQVVRTGQAAPGGLPGATLGPFGIFGNASLNDAGNMAFGFAGDAVLPLGLDAGVYRYTANTQTTTAIAAPGVTAAPTGGLFQGAVIHASINNGGDVAFAGIISTTLGIASPPSTPGVNLGVGVFRSDRKGALTSVAVPGDPAPGGCLFDFAQNPWINDGGDIAFGAHIACDPCDDFGTPQDTRIICGESIYLKQAPSGTIVSIAHHGDPAPGGGLFNIAFGPVINSRGDIVFIGDLGTDPNGIGPTGVFEFTKGALQAVARPGTAMPGGGNMTTAATIIQNYSINNGGDVTFVAALDTQTVAGTPDTGLYVQVGGTLQLVARTSTVIPGVGTIIGLFNNAGFPFPSGGSIINNRGQVLFSGVLTDESTVLLLATPG